MTRLQAYEGLRLVDITEAMPGDIVIIAGMDDVAIGDTICTKENIRVLPRLRVDEPTVAMRFTINTSPLAGAKARTSSPARSATACSRSPHQRGHQD